MEDRTFAVGDRVRWTSQASGHEKTKEGEIIAVIEAGQTVPEALLAQGSAEFDGLSSRPKRNYIVKVQGPKSAKLYRPLSGNLMKISAENAA